MAKIFTKKTEAEPQNLGINPVPAIVRFPSVYEDVTGTSKADLKRIAAELGVEIPKGEDVVEVLTDELAGLANDRHVLSRRLYFMSDRYLLHTGRFREYKELVGRGEVKTYSEYLGKKEVAPDDVLIEGEKKKVRKTPIEEKLEEKTRPVYEQELGVIAEKMHKLTAIPEVRKRYEERAQEKTKLFKQGRELRDQRRRLSEIDTLMRAFAERTSDDFARVDDTILEGLEGESAAVQKRISELEGDEKTKEEATRQDIIDIRRQLKRNGFAITPEVERRFTQLDYKLALGKPVFIWGHTGTGKSQTVREYCKRRFGTLPELQAGGENVNQYDFFGTMTVDAHKPGPVTRSLYHYKDEDGQALPYDEVEKRIRTGELNPRDSGCPLLMDEVDLIEHSELGELHYVKDAKPGEPVNIPLLGRPVIKGGRWVMFETANLKSPKYRREDMDPAYLRRDSIVEWDYLPAKETQLIMMAILSDRHGRITLGEGEDIKQVDRLAKTAEFIQKAYKGEADFVGVEASATVGGKSMLKKATMSIKDQIDIISAWKKSGFQKTLDQILLEDYVKGQTERSDQIDLVHILTTVGGFFKNYNASQISIPGIDDTMLSAWRTTT